MNIFRYGNEQEIKIASSYSELTVKQFAQLANPKRKGDLCEVLAVVSDKPYEFWFDADITKVGMEDLSNALLWTANVPDFRGLSVPKEIKINGNAVKVADDISIKTLGQELSFVQLVIPRIKSYRNDKEEEAMELTDAIAMAMAVYLQPEITGKKFDADTLPETEKLCSACNIMEAYPVANFFLNRYFTSKNVKKNSTTSPKQNKLKQGLTNSASSGTGT